MRKNIIFIGKFDLDLLSLEEKIINFYINSEKDTNYLKIFEGKNNIPDVFRYPIKYCDYDVWALVGDVKPTLLLKELISKTEIILFVINLKNQSTLAFLKEGWGPIFDKIKDPVKDRFLICITDDLKIDNEIQCQIDVLKGQFKCNQLIFKCEIGKDSKIILDPNLISYLKGKFEPEPIKNDQNKHNFCIDTISDNNNKNDEIIKEEEEEVAKEEKIKFKSRDNIYYHLSNKCVELKSKDQLNDQNEHNSSINANVNNDDNDNGEIIEEEEEVEEEEKAKFNGGENTDNYSSKKFEEQKSKEKINDQNENNFNTISNNNDDDNDNGEIIEEEEEVEEEEKSKFNGGENTDNYSANKFEEQKSKEKINDQNEHNSNTIANNNDEIIEEGKAKFNSGENNYLTAEVIESPESIGDVFIPTIIEYNSNKYIVTRICDYAFKDAKIDSISFADDSKVEQIGNFVFENSTIKKLIIPPSLKKIKSKWNEGCSQLNKIKVDKNNRYFSIDSGFLIYEQKDESGNQIIKEILFVPPCFKGKYMIPGEITSIGRSAFREHPGIKSFTSRYSSLQIIKTNCFYQCENLESINIRSYSKLALGGYCFSQCYRLSSVEIESKELLIGKNCFSNCSSLLSVNFDVTDNIILSSNAFQNCSGLDTFVINCESSAIKVLDECFYCSKYLKSIALIGSSVTLGNNFINKCASLSYLTINSQQDITITPNTFGLCNLKNVQLITASELKLEDSCFMFTTKPENVYLTFNSIKIGKDCFSKCKNLTFISIQSGQDIEIADTIISGCPSLHKLSLSSRSKLNIRDKFMRGYSSIKEIELNGSEIFIGKECFTNCESLSIFSVVKSGRFEMKENQFKNCNKLESISIQSSIVILQPNQFLNFKSLKNVKIESDSQIILESKCFSGCSNISTFSIAGSDVYIGDDCLNGCSKLNKFVLPKTSKLKLGSNVFYNCSNLDKVNLEAASELIIGDKCFNGSDIKEATFKGKKVNLGVECFVNKKFFSSCKIETCSIIGENVLICKECFRDCKKLKSFSIPSSTDIELCTSSFEGCKDLETVLLKSENTLKLNDKCFSGCSLLKSFDFTGKDIYISNYCFCYCDSLQSFTNQNSDTIILEYKSFDCCNGLENVEITANSEFSAGGFCFNCLPKLKTVKITTKKASFGDFTFTNCQSLVSFSLPTVEEYTYFDSSFIYSYNIKYHVNRKAKGNEFKSTRFANQNFSISGHQKT